MYWIRKEWEIASRAKRNRNHSSKVCCWNLLLAKRVLICPNCLELADSKQRIRDLNNKVEIYESLILQKPSVEVAQSLQCILQWSPYNRQEASGDPYTVTDSYHQNQNSLKNGLERVVGTSVLDSLRLSLADDMKSRPQRGQCTLAISNQTKKRRPYHHSNPGTDWRVILVFFIS